MKTSSLTSHSADEENADKRSSKVPRGSGVAADPHTTVILKEEPITINTPIDVDKWCAEMTSSLDDAQKQRLEIVKWLAQSNSKTNSVTNTFLSAQGLAGEMPSSLIPNVSGKMSIWAERVENILKAKGMTDLTDPLISQSFMPVILSKLSPDIARDTPNTDLEAVIKHLKSFDKVRYGLNQCLIEGRKLKKRYRRLSMHL